MARSRRGAWGAVWVGVLLVLCYAPVLSALVNQWRTNPDMAHGVFVPVLAGYVVWRKRDELAKLPVRGSGWGWALMVLGGLMVCIGPPGLATFTFMTRMAFLVSLVGAVLLLWGGRMVVALVYPLLLLLLMIPIPNLLYERVTLPLQLLASTLSEHVLDLLGYSVLREGNILHTATQTLAVAEACSGLRSLLSLMFLGQAYIYMFDSRPWMRVVIVAATVPVAILANAGRIVFTTIASQRDGDWLSGILHVSTGWTVFVLAFVCLVGVHRLVNRMRRLAGQRGEQWHSFETGGRCASPR